VKYENQRMRQEIKIVRKRSWLIVSLVVTLLVGCRTEPQQVASSTAVASALQAENIESYLADHLGVPAWNGKVFCSYEPLAAEQLTDGSAYLWALCLQYSLEEGALEVGAGISVPVALQVQEENNNWIIVDYLVPRDGSFFGNDVREIFPKSTWGEILPESRREIDQKNNLVEGLEKKIEVKARDYFGM
jgi:hypothetical protein